MMSPVTAGLLVALGLLPSLVWMFLFYHQDCHPEPKYLITKTFLMGIIISPVAVLLQIGFNQVGYWTPLNALIAQGSLFFVWAALVEEFGEARLGLFPRVFLGQWRLAALECHEWSLSC